MVGLPMRQLIARVHVTIELLSMNKSIQYGHLEEKKSESKDKCLTIYLIKQTI